VPCACRARVGSYPRFTLAQASRTMAGRSVFCALSRVTSPGVAGTLPVELGLSLVVRRASPTSDRLPHCGSSEHSVWRARWRAPRACTGQPFAVARWPGGYAARTHHACCRRGRLGRASPSTHATLSPSPDDRLQACSQALGDYPARASSSSRGYELLRRPRRVGRSERFGLQDALQTRASCRHAPRPARVCARSSPGSIGRRPRSRALRPEWRSSSKA